MAASRLERAKDASQVGQLYARQVHMMPEKHQFIIGEDLGGEAVLVAKPETEWATHYKASGIWFMNRGPKEQEAPANPEGGIAPPLPEY